MYRFIFPVNSFRNRRIVKRCSFYIQLKLSQLKSILIFYATWKHKKTTNFLFLGGTKGNSDPKWVKQQQYWRERYNLILLTWNVSSSIVKQSDCKNITTRLTQTALCKFFSLFHTTYIEDVKKILEELFFV